MKRIQMLEFEESDKEILKQLLGWFNEMHSLFIPNRVRAVQFSELGNNWSARFPGWDRHIKAMEKVFSGNILREEDRDKALEAIEAAQQCLKDRKPDQFMPNELWERYLNNLLFMHKVIKEWGVLS